MREATSSIDSTCRKDEDSRALFLAVPALAAVELPADCEAVDVKVEGDARLGVAGLLPTRLTGFHALDEDSATRVRKWSRASSRAANHCAFDFCRDEASVILRSCRRRWMQESGFCHNCGCC